MLLCFGGTTVGVIGFCMVDARVCWLFGVCSSLCVGSGLNDIELHCNLMLAFVLSRSATVRGRGQCCSPRHRRQIQLRRTPKSTSLSSPLSTTCVPVTLVAMRSTINEERHAKPGHFRASTTSSQAVSQLRVVYSRELRALHKALEQPSTPLCYTEHQNPLSDRQPLPPPRARTDRVPECCASGLDHLSPLPYGTMKALAVLIAVVLALAAHATAAGALRVEWCSIKPQINRHHHRFPAPPCATARSLSSRV